MERVCVETIAQQAGEVAGVQKRRAMRRHALVVDGVAAEQIEPAGLVGDVDLARRHPRAGQAEEPRQCGVGLERVREGLVEEERSATARKEHVGETRRRIDRAIAGLGRLAQPRAQFVGGLALGLGDMEAEFPPARAAPCVGEHGALEREPDALVAKRGPARRDDQARGETPFDPHAMRPAVESAREEPGSLAPESIRFRRGLRVGGRRGLRRLGMA
jgi:hypothetical protein